MQIKHCVVSDFFNKKMKMILFIYFIMLMQLVINLKLFHQLSLAHKNHSILTWDLVKILQN
jgi:hypothetical protein